MQSLKINYTNWVSRRSFVVFIVLLVILELIIYKDFIFGQSLFVFKDLGDDSYVQCYPVMVQRMEALTNGAIPQWSFYNGLGENTYPFWLEPVSVTIIYMFFKYDVASGMLWVQLVQTFLAGIIFFMYLRSLKLQPLAAITGALLYAFCGYVVIYGSWFLFEHSAYYVYFALLLLSLEQLISFNRWWLLPFAIALLAIAQPFSVYFSAIATTLYLLVRYADLNFSTTGLLKIISKIVVSSLLGLGLSCFLLLSNLHQMNNSPRGSGEFPALDGIQQTTMFKPANGKELSTAFLRLFSGNMQGSPDHYTGWLNYLEAPVLCSGLLVLLLIPQLFHFLTRRQKIIYGSILLFFCLIFFFPFIRSAVWLFAGNYYRTLSLIFVLFSITFAMKALNEILQINLVYKKTLFISLCAIISTLLVLNPFISNEASPSVFVIIFFLFLYAAILYAFTKKELLNYIHIAIIAAVLLELIVFVNPLLSERKTETREDMNNKTGYNDATIKILKYISDHDHSFYRVEKDYFSGTSRVKSYNEAKVQDFKGTRTYYSFNSIHYIHFLNSIGLLKHQKEPDTRWIEGLLPSPMAMRLCSVNYLLLKGDSVSKCKSLGFDSVKTIKNITLLKVNHALPLGFTYDTYMTSSDFFKIEKQSRENILLKTVVIEDGLAKQLNGMKNYISTTMGEPTLDNLYEDIEKLKKDTLSIQAFSDNSIKGNICTKKQKILFFSIPFHEGWNLNIDGNEARIYKTFDGLMGAPVSPGEHVIELKFEDCYKKTGFIISIFSMCVLLILVVFEKLRNCKKTDLLKE